MGTSPGSPDGYQLSPTDNSQQTQLSKLQAASSSSSASDLGCQHFSLSKNSDDSGADSDATLLYDDEDYNDRLEPDGANITESDGADNSDTTLAWTLRDSKRLCRSVTAPF